MTAGCGRATVNHVEEKIDFDIQFLSYSFFHLVFFMSSTLNLNSYRLIYNLKHMQHKYDENSN
jgi:hypothetical protein